MDVAHSRFRPRQAAETSSHAIRIPMKLRLLSLGRLCALLAALFLGACASVDIGAENETNARIVDLKFAAAGPFGWVDNDTFVVMMNTGERYNRKDGAEVLVARVATVNYRTGERKLFGKVSSQLCYFDGYVSYAFLDRSNDDLWVSFGELGKETTRKIKPGEINFDRGARGSCRPWSERPKNPSWTKEKTAIWPLSPYLGLLNCNVPAATVRTQYVRARFHKPDDDVGVEVPFSCYEVQMSLRYYAFEGAYFGWEFDFRSPWPVGRPRRAFWLYPTGRVETVVYPYSEIIREQAIPTVAGLIAFAQPTDRNGDYGVYLVTPEATKRILRGHAAGVTSPDGCKVAVLHDPEYKARLQNRSPKSTVTLKVLELCEKK